MRTSVPVTVGLLMTVSGSATAVVDAAAPSATCHGVTATIVGTDQRDRIIGTNRRDVIVTGKGLDRVNGRDGNDLVCAGRGPDYLRGGPGNDRLYGQGDGVLYGEDQYGDELTGGPGSDTLNGGPGMGPNDRGLDIVNYRNAPRRVVIDLSAQTATVGEQRETIVSIEEVDGSRFGDVIRGDRHYQTLSGRGGADRLYGRGKVDFLFGDDGDDEVYGGPSRDIMYGGAGTDKGLGGPGADQCSNFEQRSSC